MQEDGLALPVPTSLQSVMNIRENRDGVAIAEAGGMTRSGFLVSAAQRAIEADAA